MVFNKQRLKKAQAAAELAVFGTLILVLFGSILTYTQSLNDEHITTMQSFRRALNEAYSQNAAVSFNMMKTDRNVDLNAPLKGVRAQQSGSASVYWAVPDLTATEANSDNIYKVNEHEFSYDPDSEKIDDIQIISNESATDSFVKTETTSGISTTSTTDVDSTITFVFKDESGGELRRITQSLVNDGSGLGSKYVSGSGGNYRRTRKWDSTK